MAGGTKKSAKAQGTGSLLEYVEFNPSPVCASPVPPPMGGYTVHVRADIQPTSGLMLRTTPTFKIYNMTTLVQSGALSPNGPYKWKSDPIVSVMPTAVQVSAIIGNPYDPSKDETYTSSTTVGQCPPGGYAPMAVAQAQTFPDFTLDVATAGNGNKTVKATIVQGTAMCAHLQLFQLGGPIGHERDMDPHPNPAHPNYFDVTILKAEAATAKFAHVIMHFEGPNNTVLTKEKGIQL